MCFTILILVNCPKMLWVVKISGSLTYFKACLVRRYICCNHECCTPKYIFLILQTLFLNSTVAYWWVIDNNGIQYQSCIFAKPKAFWKLGGCAIVVPLYNIFWGACCNKRYLLHSLVRVLYHLKWYVVMVP